MSAPLLISADVGQVSAHQLETWGNEDIIDISQNFRAGGPYQGVRLVGGDLNFGKATDGSYTGSGSNVWGKLLPDGDVALVFVSNEDVATNVTCDKNCFGQILDDSVEAYAFHEIWSGKKGTLTRPFSLTQLVQSHGGVAVFRLSPSKSFDAAAVERIRRLDESNPHATYTTRGLANYRGGGCYRPSSVTLTSTNGDIGDLVLTEKDLARVRREDGDPPLRIDWREHGAVGPVQQQHPFGTCWAFSTVAVTEAINVIQGKNAYEKLSEQMVVSCVPAEACGDNADVLWEWALKNTNARYQTEAVYPYNRTCNFFRETQLAPDGTNDGYNMTCRDSNSPFDIRGDDDCIPGIPVCPCPPCPGVVRKDGTPKCAIDESRGFSKARVRGWGFISPHGESTMSEEPKHVQDVTRMTAALLKYGPAQIGIDASCLEGYESGIITNCTSSDVDHAVAIVGMGTENGIDYWLVRNSWNYTFGEDGYFRVQRDTAQMGIFGGYFGCYDEHCMVDP